MHLESEKYLFITKALNRYGLIKDESRGGDKKKTKVDFRGKGGFKRKGEGVSIKKREVVKVGRPGEGGLRSRRGEEERVLVRRHFDQNLHSHLDQKLVSLACSASPLTLSRKLPGG